MKKPLVILLPALLALASCSQKASFSGTLTGAPESPVVVTKLNVNTFDVLDTITTSANGKFSYKLDVRKGDPEFVYLYYGDTRIAGLLLETGDHAVLVCDTLGNYSVSGSEASESLRDVEQSYARFMRDLENAYGDNQAMAGIYIQHYRECVKYVLENPHSLTSIPVLYERMSEISPVFNQSTDALIFRGVADSLMTVYPDSRYVKALDHEANRRLRLLELENKLRSTEVSPFPDLNLPDINGERRSLSALDSKAILVHFWDETDAAQKMMNIDTLLPIYEDFHNRGFEIYSVCVSADKASWGAGVKAQKLPWINVCDGLGTASPAIVSYNVSSLPTSILIVDGEISTTKITGAEGLRKELGRVLRR